MTELSPGPQTAPSNALQNPAWESLLASPALPNAGAKSLRAHAGFGLLVEAQVNELAILLSSHGLNSPAHSWPDKKGDILLEGRQSVVIPIHRGLPLATGPYRFNAAKRHKKQR